VDQDEGMATSSIDDNPKEGKPAIDDESRLEALLSSPVPSIHDHEIVSNKRDMEKEERVAPKPSREDLLRRHREAERMKAITVCKNLVAKHEALEARQAAKLNETNAALEEARRELEENRGDIEKAEQSVATLKLRKQAVESLIGEYVTKLVDARHALHVHKTTLDLGRQERDDYISPL
jgi:chromosome segregation ATPase